MTSSVFLEHVQHEQCKDGSLCSSLGPGRLESQAKSWLAVLHTSPDSLVLSLLLHHFSPTSSTIKLFNFGAMLMRYFPEHLQLSRGSVLSFKESPCRSLPSELNESSCACRSLLAPLSATGLIPDLKTNPT